MGPWVIEPKITNLFDQKWKIQSQIMDFKKDLCSYFLAPSSQGYLNLLGYINLLGIHYIGVYIQQSSNEISMSTASQKRNIPYLTYHIIVFLSGFKDWSRHMTQPPPIFRNSSQRASHMVSLAPNRGTETCHLFMLDIQRKCWNNRNEFFFLSPNFRLHISFVHMVCPSKSSRSHLRHESCTNPSRDRYAR